MKKENILIMNQHINSEYKSTVLGSCQNKKPTCRDNEKTSHPVDQELMSTINMLRDGEINGKEAWNSYVLVVSKYLDKEWRKVVSYDTFMRGYKDFIETNDFRGFFIRLGADFDFGQPYVMPSMMTVDDLSESLVGDIDLINRGHMTFVDAHNRYLENASSVYGDDEVGTFSVDTFMRHVKQYNEHRDVEELVAGFHALGQGVRSTWRKSMMTHCVETEEKSKESGESDESDESDEPGGTGNPVKQNLETFTTYGRTVSSPKEYDDMNYVTKERRFVKLLDFDKGEKVTPDLVLTRIGCVPAEWEIVRFKTEAWEVAMRDQATNRECRLVAVTMKPRVEVVEANEWREEAVAAFAKDIPARIPKVKRGRMEGFDKLKVMEVAPIELHLGKVAYEEESGDTYNIEVASLRFNEIIDGIVDRQSREKCSRCIFVIGNDFFNSESNSMTTRGTPQTNDTSTRNMFRVGLELHEQALLTIGEHFDHVEVLLCAGNHARNMEYFMYTALRMRFSNFENLNFRTDTKDTQAIKFGKCAIFFNHGDKNWKRTVQSIPSEFPQIWGQTVYRELHMGHFHSEHVAQEGAGLTVRRISSPSGTDAWHYENRFIGALKRHQIFIWDAESGLRGIYYIKTESS